MEENRANLINRESLMRVGVLVFIVLVVFGRAAAFPFTNWDDQHYLVENPHLVNADLSGLKALWRVKAVEDEQLFIPITYTSHWVEAALFGLKPAVVHTTNLVLHLLNCVLVFLLLLRFTHRNRIAFVCSLIFAIHPLQVEAVAWCMGRKDLLSTFLALSALLLYDQYLDQRSWWRAPLVILLYLLAVMAKPSVLLLPLVFVLLHIRYLKRLRLQEYAGLMVCACIAAVFYLANRSLAPVPPADAPALGMRIVTAPVMAIQAAWRFISMLGIGPMYAWPKHELLFYLWLVVGLGLLSVIGWTMRKRPALIFPIAIFILLYAPAIFLVVEYREFVTADRYSYLPMFAVSWLAAIATMQFRRPDRISGGIIAAWLVAAGLVSMHSVGYWQSSERLWERAIVTSPQSSSAYNNYASALLDAGRKDRALRAYQRSAELNPGNHKVWNNLSNLYLVKRDYDRAIAAATKADELLPGYPEANHNWGVALLALDQPHKAVERFRVALSGPRQRPETILQMGCAFEQTGSVAKAITCYLKVLELAPRLTNAHIALARAYMRDGRKREAQGELEKLLKTDPANQAGRDMLRKLETD